MYKVYDNFLPIQLENFIYEEITSEYFPWYRSNSGYKTVIPTDNSKKWSNVCEGTQLCHQFIHLDKSKDNSCFKETMISMLQNMINHVALDWNINEVNILRCKANIQLNNYNSKKQFCHNPPHIDYSYPHLVFLYYINDSDGDTIIFDRENRYKKIVAISPKRGRLVVFNGDHYHASSPPMKFDSRIVINTNIELL